MSIYNQIMLAQKRDLVALESLINQFKPLIIKYSRYDDDLQSDITLHFIYTIYKIPLYKFTSDEDKFILSYISQSIRHYAFQKYKKNTDILGENFLIFLYDKEKYFDDESNLIFYDLIKDLSEKERLVLTKKFIENYKNNEIALDLNLSRQNIYSCIKRSLNKIKKSLNEEELYGKRSL